MQLDRTRIPIRERNLGDILDLSLRVVACEFGGLVFCLSLFAIPLMVLNAWLLRNLVAPMDESELLVRYLVAQASLIAVETPAGTMIMTLFLGEVLFFGDKNIWRSLRSLGVVWWRFLFCFGIRRLIIPGIALAATIPRSFLMSSQEGWLVTIAVVATLMQLARPYLAEIILLERAPLFEREAQAVKISRRSRLLHSSGLGEALWRQMISGAVALIVLGSILGTVHFLIGTLSFDWERGAFFYRVVIPAAIWLVSGLMAVIRFLCYLDQRIRNEGWEVELLVKAAADELSWGAKSSHG